MSADPGYQALRTTAGVYLRGPHLYEVDGPGREALLGHLLARPTEYAQSGTIVDSLALDDDGRPVDLILAVIDETRTILLSDSVDSILPHLTDLATAAGIPDIGCRPLDGWAAAAVEGPRAWEVIQDLVEEDVAGILLNEWRTVRVPIADDHAILARTGTTAEYGYVVLARAAAPALLDWLRGLAAAVGGRECGPEALRRARLEVNHPVLPEQFDGLTVREAGAAWMAGGGRTGAFRGNGAVAAPTRRLVAVRADSPDDLVAGAPVMAGGRPVGRVHLVAPRVGLESSVGLALLDTPFDVPGLALDAGPVRVSTVARPAVEPVSWVEGIG